MSDAESERGADGVGGDSNNGDNSYGGIPKDVLAIVLWIADLSLRFCTC